MLKEQKSLISRSSCRRQGELASALCPSAEAPPAGTPDDNERATYCTAVASGTLVLERSDSEVECSPANSEHEIVGARAVQLDRQMSLALLLLTPSVLLNVQVYDVSYDSHVEEW